MHDNISLKTKFKIVTKYKNDSIVLFEVLILMVLVKKDIYNNIKITICNKLFHIFFEMMNHTKSG